MTHDQPCMRTYLVSYRYLATGMEGHADVKTVTVAAENEDDAINQVILTEYPKDKMYGPSNTYSSRDFLRACLSASEAV